MIKVLQVYPKLSNAGTEAVILNLYKNIDRNKVQFDFLVEEKGELDNLINELGGNVFYIKEKSEKRYYKRLINFFNTHEYKIVHTHTHGRMGIVLKVANIMGVKTRIAHSHNSRSDLPKVFKIYKIITSRHIEKNSTHFFACSSLAAEWLFPSKYKQARIVNNAIDLKKFSYDESMREKIRSENNIDLSTKVVCHVGRFSKEKNHEFIVQIANELFKKDDSIKLILVGVGPLEKKIKQLVKNLGIEDKILFLGNRSDVNNILSASDIFILPSLYEGLGIVLVEAQASGLYSIASKGIPSEADIGVDLFEKEDLSKGSKAWAEKILEKLDDKLDRKQSSGADVSKFEIKKTAEALEELYLEIN